MDRKTQAGHTAWMQRDDVLIRLQRSVGLASSDGLGTVRRAIFWALLGWGPVAAWAVLSGRVHAPDGESLLAHFGVTARLLLAVPIMVVAEAVLAGSVIRLGRESAASGVLHADPVRLRDVVDGLCRLRDRVHPWAVAAGIALGWLLGWHETVAAQASHALAWAGEDGRSGFGVRWYLWVALPIFLSFVATWLWRVVLLGIALYQLAHSGLRLVPTHPDRAGGLGFATSLMVGFGVTAFGLSAVIAAGWAHDVTWHGVRVDALRADMAAAVGLLTAIFVAPLAVLLGPMSRAKRRARLDYGALVARHGDAVGWSMSEEDRAALALATEGTPEGWTLTIEGNRDAASFLLTDARNDTTQTLTLPLKYFSGVVTLPLRVTDHASAAPPRRFAPEFVSTPTRD